VVADRRLGGWEGASPRPSALPLGELEAADGFFFFGTNKNSELSINSFGQERSL
jgi:hypothetical protein